MTTPAPAPAANRLTLQLIALAEKAGLNPSPRDPYGNTYHVVLDAKAGPDSTHGTITVGKHSGRVLRGALIHGNGQPVIRLDSPHAVRAALKNYAERAATTADVDPVCGLATSTRPGPPPDTRRR